jgi:predicted metal-dependent phosphoesterase TrpH
MKLKVDLHTHTNLSKDGGQTPKELVDRVISLGFDAIAVTDHNTVEGSLIAEKYAKGKPIIVFPGQEVETRQGEIIVLNVRKTIQPYRDLQDTVNEASKAGGFIIAPHPFDLMRKGIGRETDKILDKIDAIETFNSRTIWTRFNNRARSYAEEAKKPVVAGSDSHFPDEINKTYTLVNSKKSPSAILNAISKGRVELVTEAQSRFSKLMRGFRKLRSYI